MCSKTGHWGIFQFKIKFGVEFVHPLWNIYDYTVLMPFLTFMQFRAIPISIPPISTLHNNIVVPHNQIMNFISIRSMFTYNRNIFSPHK